MQQEKMWKLIAPDGREYTAESKLKCCVLANKKEISERDQLRNLRKALWGYCELCDHEFIEGQIKHYLGDKECPAYLYPLCGACWATIVIDAVKQDKI